MFTLPDLPYSFDALEPHIDTKTMEIHHDKHHSTYVTNLNNALEPHKDWLNKPVETVLQELSQIPEEIRTAVRNNGGGHANHSLFWTLMKPGMGGEPTGQIATAIDTAFGSFDKFKELFTTAGTGRFGSGWVWLVSRDGKLNVGSTANQDNPLMGETIAGLSGSPLLALDVWEHAYYLKYQNKRPDYITAWWNTINWDRVNELLSAVK